MSRGPAAEAGKLTVNDSTGMSPSQHTAPCIIQQGYQEKTCTGVQIGEKQIHVSSKST